MNLKTTQETQTGALYQPRGVGWDGEGDGREVEGFNNRKVLCACVTHTQREGWRREEEKGKWAKEKEIQVGFSSCEF